MVAITKTLKNPKMFEDAVITAKALQEVAIKSAEKEILSKFHAQVKEAADRMLMLEQPLKPGEQPEEEIPGMQNDSPVKFGADAVTGEKDIFSSVPSAAVGGERLCPCPAEDDEIEIDLTMLAKQVGKEIEGGGEVEGAMGGEIPPEALPPPIEGEDEEDKNKGLPLHEAAVSVDENDTEGNTAILDEIVEALFSEKDSSLEANVPYEPEGEKPEAEKEPEQPVVVDMANGSSHENGRFNDTSPQIKQKNLELNAKLAADTKAKEELEKNKKAVKSLQESLDKSNKIIAEHNELFGKLQDKMSKMALLNARLFYANQALGNPKLNGRQKQELVESLSKTENSEKAKAVYDMFVRMTQSTPSTNKKAPESLGQTGNNRAVMYESLSPRRTQTNVREENEKERMQTLAGIRKLPKEEEN